MKTLARDFKIQDDFPPVGYDQWRSLVEKALDGAPFERKLVTHTYEGVDIQPVYSRENRPTDGDAIGLPGIPPYSRGSQPLGAALTGWDSRPEHAHPDLAVTNRAILADLEGGATSLLLRLDDGVRCGFDPDQGEVAGVAGCLGVMAHNVDDFDAVLTGVQLELVTVALDAGAAFLPAAAALAGLWRRRNIPSEKANGAFCSDPLAIYARNGELPISPQDALSQLSELVRWTASNYPRVTSVGVDTSPYDDAGATAVQDIAFAIATAVEYLRAMPEMNIDLAAKQFLFRFGLGTDHFLSIAKLRAARRLWSRVVQACGGSASAQAMQIHARTSNRVLTRRDPYVNLLRNTVAVFAAGVGGAEIITSVPFDATTGLPDDFSRRIARNTVLVLQEEAHLHRVVDPAGGSWFLDQLSEQLAESAWEVFQQVERQGGMLSSLQSGWVAEQIAAGYVPRAKDIARRKQGITGVSEFPDISEQGVAHPPTDPSTLRAAAAMRVVAARTDSEALVRLTSTNDRVATAVDAATSGATIGQMATAIGFHNGPSSSIPPLEPRPFAEPFEELRDASDAWLEKNGHRPRVFLANMGPIAHHTPRASYAKNFFEVGGFEVITNDGFDKPDDAAQAFAASGARIAVICSSDRIYEQLVTELAPRLKSAGARSVVLAGNPGDKSAAWQTAGVDRFIFIKCDVLEILRELLREEGAIRTDAE